MEGAVDGSKQTVAGLLGVSVETVLRMLKRGELPHYRINRVIRIPLAEVERYRRERMTRDWHPYPKRKKSAAS